MKLVDDEFAVSHYWCHWYGGFNCNTLGFGAQLADSIFLGPSEFYVRWIVRRRAEELSS